MKISTIFLAASFVCVAVCTAQDAASPKPAKKSNYQFDLSDKEHYKPALVSRDGGGLAIASSNFSSQIRQCKSINKVSIADLEKLMRPGSKDKRGSMSGFLGDDEGLLDILVEDNEFVRKHGLTHRKLAIPLLQISNRAVGMLNSEQQPFEFSHAGINWRVQVKYTRGYQFSPFNDGTKTSTDFTLTNLDNEQTIKFSGLVPLMIERYGFYEGKGTPYRVEPADIIKVLGLDKEKSDRG